jgi:hypothetical protein
MVEFACFLCTFKKLKLLHLFNGRQNFNNLR